MNIGIFVRKNDTSIELEGVTYNIGKPSNVNTKVEVGEKRTLSIMYDVRMIPQSSLLELNRFAGVFALSVKISSIDPIKLTDYLNMWSVDFPPASTVKIKYDA